MIRYATKEDIIIVFAYVNLLENGKLTFEQFEICFEYNLQNNYILLYEENGNVLGVGVFSVSYPLHHSGKIAEVLELVVNESVRGKGIGKKLLDKMTELAMDKGCVGIEVTPNRQRTNAHRFYEREGFSSTHYKFTKELYKCSKLFMIFPLLK